MLYFIILKLTTLCLQFVIMYSWYFIYQLDILRWFLNVIREALIDWFFHLKNIFILLVMKQVICCHNYVLFVELIKNIILHLQIQKSLSTQETIYLLKYQFS